MHSSTLVTSICTISLKAFCRFVKHEEMLSMPLDQHFYSFVHSLKGVNQYIKVQT